MNDPTTSFEFNEQQEVAIRKLAKTLLFLGVSAAIVSVISSVAFVWQFLVRDWDHSSAFLMIALFCGVTGRYMIKAGGAFRKVVNETGSDIANLMVALEALSSKYMYLAGLFLFVLLLALIAGSEALQGNNVTNAQTAPLKEEPTEDALASPVSSLRRIELREGINADDFVRGETAFLAVMPSGLW